jgi:hypothetical protein
MLVLYMCVDINSLIIIRMSCGKSLPECVQLLQIAFFSIWLIYKTNIYVCRQEQQLGYQLIFHCQQYFSYIVAVNFIGGGNQSTQRKPLTCRKPLTNFITKCCIEYTSPEQGSPHNARGDRHWLANFYQNKQLFQIMFLSIWFIVL